MFDILYDNMVSHLARKAVKELPIQVYHTISDIYLTIPNRTIVRTNDCRTMNDHIPSYNQAIASFDSSNAEDPNIEVVDGKTHPKELIYAQRMTERLQAFNPAASEALKLAARCQHIRRWEIPRSEFPLGRSGYRQWRNRLMRFHADTAARILDEAGYDSDTIERVRALVSKKGLKKDPEAQTLEDVICLVFLEHYFADFAKKHDEEKLIDILKKTWLKMSPKGRQASMELNLSAMARTLVEKALEAA